MNPSTASSEPVICEVCGAYFENRRGLSSHARLHLRQLGVTFTENSGSPIELLYQLIEEKDGSAEVSEPNDSASASTPPKKADGQLESKMSPVQEEFMSFSKSGGRVLSKLQKSDHQESPSKLKEQRANLLPSSPSSLMPHEGSSSSFSNQQTKPLWAPSETDAPITLASVSNDEVHVCQLCGSWYETRKGLSSHARAHLRQIGIPDSEIKSAPIEYLYQIMKEQDLKPISAERQDELKPTSPSKSSSKRPFDVSSSPASTPGKRPKASADFTCVLCGEEFENRKGLGSHARSHLRHIGVSDLVGKSNAISAVEELVSSGMIEPVHLPKLNGAASSSAAPSPAPASPVVPGKQSKTAFSPVCLSPSSQSPPSLLNKAPKAKKGFRLAVDPLHRKPKPEPVETEVFIQPKPSSSDSSSSMQKVSTAPISKKPSDADVLSPPTVLCDFCGQLFDTRKALSCHVRAHLRQLGVTWSIRTSPIDLLKSVMSQGEERKDPARSRSSAAGKAPWSAQGSRRSRSSLPPQERASNSNAGPVDYSMKDKSPSKAAGSNLEASCDLCGFDFENRKALASHARAHLRQLGIFEWRADGARSPIELLSELIRRDPNKVAEITRRYRFGDLYIKKSQRSAALSSPSTDSDSVPSSSQKASLQHHQHKASRMDHSVRTSRGVHAPQHGVSSGDEKTRHPPRSGSIPALLPKPPLTPLVKLVGKMYSLKCRFCEEVFQGPLSVQEKWISHLQKHIQSLGYKGKEAPAAAPPAAPDVPAPPAAPALIHPVAV